MTPSTPRARAAPKPTNTLAPLRVTVRASHARRLDALHAKTGLDRQVLLNRAIARAAEDLAMKGTTLAEARAQLQRQRSAARARLVVHPTAATVRLLRRADHREAASILLQTGLNLWTA